MVVANNRVGKLSRYEEIANSIAKRIADGDLREGERIHGRSTLAASYHVSPETIRRALHLLRDQTVVEVAHGSGIRVLSQANAQAYLTKSQAQSDFYQLHGELGHLLAQRDGINQRINTIYSQIFAAAVSYMDHPQSLMEVPVADDSSLIGEELDPIKVWVDQGVTVVSVKRSDKVLPPYKAGQIQAGDILILVDSPQTKSNFISDVNDDFNKKQTDS